MLASPVSLAADEAVVEAAVVSGVSTTPQTVRLRFLPTAPGRQRIRVIAQLAGEKVGEVGIDVEVGPAEPKVDVAKEKLAKLFGDE